MIYLIDLFAGAGGVTTGAERSKNVTVIACVNHDANAIKSHAANHPNCKHFTEDIRILDLSEIKKIVLDIRRKDPNAKIGLWASLECTNFSKAKGGLSRNADSRTLAEHLFRYLDELNPDIIYIENVEEFMTWGPLDAEGKSIKEFKGVDYKRWVEDIKKYGYDFDYKILNAADYGACTSRKRYFAQFAKSDCTIAWPQQTHAKSTKLKEGLKPWVSARKAIDLSIIGPSIFDRKKNYSDKTYERIYKGLVKFVTVGENVFLTAYYGNGDNVHHINSPSPTIPTKDRVTVVHVEQFIMRDFSNGGNICSLDNPAGTVTSIPKINIVTPFMIDAQYSNSGKSLDAPAQTLIARMDKTPPYIVQASCGALKTEIKDTDTQFIIKIKEFMIEHNLSDVFMRPVSIPELKKIQGFDEDYILLGNQSEQKKYIGNAVEVNQAFVILDASASANIHLKIAV